MRFPKGKQARPIYGCDKQLTF